jgi:protein subunit release factor A
VKDSIRSKLERLAARHEEVAVLLSQPGAADDANRFRDLSQEYARLEPLAQKFRAFNKAEADLGSADEARTAIRACGYWPTRNAAPRPHASKPWNRSL